jgi:hypothetical protein
MNGMLAKNLTGIAGYVRFMNPSQIHSITSKAKPITIKEMTAADFQGYMVPPQLIPIRKIVRPAVHRKILR